MLAAVTLIVALALVGVAAWNWSQTWSWWTLVWWLFVLLAVRASRPEFSATAGAPAAALQPLAGAPIVALATLTSAALGPRPFWVEGADSEEPVDLAVERLVRGLPPMAAVLAGTLAWQALTDSEPFFIAPLAAALASVLTARGLEVVCGRPLPLHAGDLLHLVWWLTAWAAGSVLVAAAQAHPGWVAIGLAALLAVRREGSWQEVSAGDSIGRAADVPAWVEEIYALSLEATRCAWFELRLAVDNSAERWSAGPDQQLIVGPAGPPGRPPVRFGLYRRPSWIIERHQRSVGDSEIEVLLWRDPRVPVEADLADHLERIGGIVAAGRFDRAVANLPGGELVNRQRVLELLNGAFASARESGEALAIALVGLDHSRELQEVHGAEICEQAMSRIGDTFAGLLGDSDAVCRYGGEEYLALFLGRTGDGAVEAAEAIREEVSRIELELDGEPILVTASVGIAAHPEVYVPRPSELIPLADSALYEARRCGGNRSLLATGRGRFRDQAGEVIEGSAESQEVAAPRLFV